VDWQSDIIFFFQSIQKHQMFWR